MGSSPNPGIAKSAFCHGVPCSLNKSLAECAFRGEGVET